MAPKMRSTGSLHSTTFVFGSTLALLFVAACESAPPEPVAEPKPRVQNTQVAGNGQGDVSATKTAAPKLELPKPSKRKISAKPVAEVKPSPDDPIKGKWALADAVKGLPEGKTISATIETDMGNIECKLFDDKAPITVANFVGLARGLRPWKTPEGKWAKKPAYDDTVFHRIIKGFMIQGGDAMKNGTGEAGYVIPDEVWEDANHDRPGLLCMANRGANTNSAQFFITDDAANHLDGGYTIFGECGPVETIHKIANVEVVRDKPTTVPVIKKITITRK
jgi:peptidyl-prolyl cis-trans isomerase A (cyclophilin A)